MPRPDRFCQGRVPAGPILSAAVNGPIRQVPEGEGPHDAGTVAAGSGERDDEIGGTVHGAHLCGLAAD